MGPSSVVREFARLSFGQVATPCGARTVPDSDLGIWLKAPRVNRRVSTWGGALVRLTQAAPERLVGAMAVNVPSDT